MTMSISNLPIYITCKLVPDKQLNPKQKGMVIVTYDASKRNDFGYVNDQFTLLTNDSIQPEKTIKISANIVEDFSKLTPEQLQNAPKITFENSTYNFGTIREGDKVEHDYTFSNTGKSELIIRKTKVSCGCTAGTPEKTNLKPGESSKIHVIFNSAGKSGQQRKTITIICNDPSNSTAIINLEGTIDKKETPNPQEQSPKQ
jgi:hypothetical protein